jgi:putative transport protein
MTWMQQLFNDPSTVAHTVLILSLVAAAGLALGTLQAYGVGLGVAGVLFAGLAFGHFRFQIDPRVLDFVREFGLILFVYSIGLQVGPGFLASLRKQGLPLNLMAAAIVLLGVAVTLVIYFAFMDRSQAPAVVGLFSGATTNTPSLAAAQQALKDVQGVPPEAMKLPGLAYAVAYPFGIVGIIVAMLLTRAIFRINPKEEAALLTRLQAAETDNLARVNLEITNPNLQGLRLGQVPTLAESGVVISRVLKGRRPQMARADTVLSVGDVLLAVGPRPKLEELKVIVGKESPVDLRSIPSDITTRRIVVTRSDALGKSIQELQIGQRLGVRVTRISRAEIELAPTPAVKLQFGDNLVVVGEEDSVRQLAAELGDSVKKLSYPQIIPMFVGISLGVILGSWPINVWGMPAPVKLGLAGGPLLVAILLSWLGNIGPLIWYMPISANFALREVGIVLFLAAVGLRAGDSFIITLVQGQGLHWMLYGTAITLLPLLIVALFARAVYKLNYLSLCGLLAGSMTDPPALAFAGAMTHSDVPSISYATVYPLVMLLRVVSAQVMILLLMR